MAHRYDRNCTTLPDPGCPNSDVCSSERLLWWAFREGNCEQQGGPAWGLLHPSALGRAAALGSYKQLLSPSEKYYVTLFLRVAGLEVLGMFYGHLHNSWWWAGGDPACFFHWAIPSPQQVVSGQPLLSVVFEWKISYKQLSAKRCALMHTDVL